MTKLSVNINKVATLRNTRTLGIPSVLHAASLCIAAGAHGITIHPRPDERHIRGTDVYELADLLRKHPTVEFNIEGNPLIEYMHHVEAVKPTQCTLVPDAREAFTSNQGWDLSGSNESRLRPLIKRLKDLGCRVSLFMDAGTEQLQKVKQLGADRIELYTEPYAAAFSRGDRSAVDAYATTAQRALDLGLGINAGHDLNLHNLPFFLSKVSGVAEVSIGHALMGDALEFGLPETVKKYLAACEAGRATK